MKMLAVDTATRICSAAVVENGGLLAEFTLNHGHTHTTRLMPVICSVLEQARLAIRELDGLAVTIGPGSFTGLRIGLSTVKGLGLATGLPVAGISTLDCLAGRFAFVSTLICPMIDARKDEVYASLYVRQEESLKEVCPARAVSPAEVLQWVNKPCLFVGNGARLYRNLIKETAGRLAVFPPEEQNHVQAATVGLLGQRLLASGRQTPLSCLVPWYIRQSDAERKFVQDPAGA
ncbi:MAG: tRNA (adenosine(37)-N6)-threonylcarbamoyltransferase complex dimerization subunit type 1 TsaB [Desulfosalsimonadaceae bacterium]